MTRSVGENLTEWETGSPSSDGGTQGASVSGGLLMSSSVKYIPINYFEYFDSAHLDRSPGRVSPEIRLRYACL